eukprot:CAMPEP_0202978210 /NCGR_PEP_ID=MMETSP1396-20130829/84712_1 /ASSEMBLY_ACC=CAM_ASM_000872 /TAXON_ID= /ORGANISM="Pseudokeronopsis sp., Strain Brazil" /LENGTH=86 /DNA_ID=CAMNT_0049717111 /DNA_START=2092 /DNA_END=2352 /DNA_ORIENTATION=+
MRERYEIEKALAESEGRPLGFQKPGSGKSTPNKSSSRLQIAFTVQRMNELRSPVKQQDQKGHSPLPPKSQTSKSATKVVVSPQKDI